MGFRFRKSFGKGPFRMTISKSGIGYSVGGKGARFTKKAGGGTRSTLSIPGTGISYVTDSKKKKEKTPMKKAVKENTSATTTSKKTKKPIWKRWWVWVLIIICLFSAVTGGNDAETSPEVSIPPAIEETLPETEVIPEEEFSPSIEEKPAESPAIEEIVNPVPPAVEEPTPTVKYVLITRTGTKYHDKFCGSVDGKTDLTEMTEDQAIAAGYSACGKCKP